MTDGNALRFLKEAQEDYEELDGSQKKWVKAALQRLEERGGEIGEQLYKHEDADLCGCKKLKNNKMGLRIVFRENKTNELDIIEIIVIGKRKDLEVYITAGKRIQSMSEIYDDLSNWYDQMHPRE